MFFKSSLKCMVMMYLWMVKLKLFILNVCKRYFHQLFIRSARRYKVSFLGDCVQQICFCASKRCIFCIARKIVVFLIFQKMNNFKTTNRACNLIFSWLFAIITGFYFHTFVVGSNRATYLF